MNKRKVELFDVHMELKKWVRNENEIVSRFIEEASQLRVQVGKMEDDVANTAKQLKKNVSIVV